MSSIRSKLKAWRRFLWLYIFWEKLMFLFCNQLGAKGLHRYMTPSYSIWHPPTVHDTLLQYMTPSYSTWHPTTVNETLLQYMTPSYSTWHPPTVYGCFYFVIYWGPKASRRAPTALCRSEKEGGHRPPESSRPKKGLKKMWSLSISDSPCFIFQQLDTTYL